MAILALKGVDVGEAYYYNSRKDLFKGVYRFIEEQPVIAAYPGSWNDLDELMDHIAQEGYNPYMIDVVDPVFEHRLALGKIESKVIVQARYSRLAIGLHRKAHYRISVNKRISRRGLFSNPLKSLVEYVYAPLLSDPLGCESLKNCSICINSCPYSALKGKPPRVNVDACTSCGICLQVCPIEALSMPRTTIDGVEYYTSIISRNLGGVGLVVVISIKDIKELYKIEHSRLEAPLLVFPVDSVVEVTPFMLARFGLRGLYPVIYMPSMRNLEPRIVDVLEEMSSIGLVDVIETPSELAVKSKSLPGLKIYGEISPREYVRELVHSSMEEALLSVPVAGVVYVNDKCTLCGACVTACPTNALKVKENSWVKLLFKYNDCIACKECEASCPEDAIRVRWEAKKALKGVIVEEAYSDIARCRSCGAPIGPVKLIERVGARLRERSVASSILEGVRLCNECKVRRAFYEAG